MTRPLSESEVHIMCRQNRRAALLCCTWIENQGTDVTGEGHVTLSEIKPLLGDSEAH